MDSGPLTQAQALDLLRRTSDEGWLASELSSPDGTAVINSRTAIAAATSQALQDQVDACMISTAPGGRSGVCVLTLTRRLTGTFVDIPAGYPFRTNEGIDLRVSQPVTMLNTDLTVNLYLETLRSTELVNTFVPAFDALLTVGDLMATGTAAVAISDYIYVGPDKVPQQEVLGPGTFDADTSLRYASSTLITLAASDWLSVHGNERGQRKQAGETVEEYRARIRLFPDAVSPIAIATAAHAAGRNAKLPDVYLLETVSAQVSPDLLAQYSLALADSPFCDDYMDDPIGFDLPEKRPWRSLEMVSIREGRAYFRLSMNGPLNEPDGATLYFEDGFLDDELWGYPDGLLAERILGALMTVPSAVAPIKAGGVLFDFYIEDGVVVPDTGAAVGYNTLAAPVVVWTLRSDPLVVLGSESKAWLLSEALVSHSPSGTIWHQVTFTFADLTTFTTPVFSNFDSEHLTTSRLVALGYPFGRPVVQIQGTLQSDGVQAASLVGTFWATTYSL